MHIRVSQIADVFQKMIFESCTLFHIMPFAKIIGHVEKNRKNYHKTLFKGHKWNKDIKRNILL